MVIPVLMAPTGTHIDDLRRPPANYMPLYNIGPVESSQYIGCKYGSLYVRSITAGNQLLQFFELNVSQPLTVRYTVNKPFAGLWYIQQGNSRFVLEGVGSGTVKSDVCILSLLSCGVANFARYDEGLHAFMCVSLLPLHMTTYSSQLPQFRYFEQQARNDRAKALQLSTLTATDDMREQFKLFKQKAGAENVLDITSKLIDKYGQRIIAKMEKEGIDEKHIVLAISVKEYLDTAYSTNISFEDVIRKFHSTEHIIQKSFQLITGQTVAAYIKEQKLLFMRELVMTTKKTLKECSDEVGYNEDTLSTEFKARFGMTPKEMRKKMEVW